MKPIITLLLFTSVIQSVKIGISKPLSLNENVTTESTIRPTSTSTTTETIQTTQPTSTFNKSASISPSTTPIPSSITTTMKTPTNNNYSQENPRRNMNMFRSGYYCSCDLRPNFCDINCCCDAKCVPEELVAFDCNREKSRLEDFNYQQGLPPCRINEGWLCVFRTNVDISKSKNQNYIFDSTTADNWPQLLKDDDDVKRDRSFYKIGEPLLLYSLDNNEIIEFDIPFSLAGLHCQIKEAVRHLQSKKSTCLLSLEDENNLSIKLFQNLYNSFLLQRPNIQIPFGGVIKENLEDFIPITIFCCSKEDVCFPVSMNYSCFEYFNDTSYSSLIKTKITHNITHLMSCEIFFIQSEEKNYELWQNYQVDFVHINETQESTLNVSGHLGYIVGRPLVIGQKVSLNESAEYSDSNYILSYFNTKRRQQVHMFIPRRRQDRCEDSQLTVNFGESILVQCSVQIDNSTELTTETNFTQICIDLQNRAFQFLKINKILNLQDDFFLSVLGYPRNESDYWTKIELRNYDRLPVYGVYLDKEDSFMCQNMILGIKFKFLTVTKSIDGILHQNLLQSATLEMEKRHDLQYQLDEIVSIPLTFSTIFHDIQQTNKADKCSACIINIIVNYLLLIYLNTNK